ncbi:hypothetical protein BH20BAC1_BH20BAC1_03510 [soil metagenome]
MYKSARLLLNLDKRLSSREDYFTIESADKSCAGATGSAEGILH